VLLEAPCGNKLASPQSSLVEPYCHEAPISKQLQFIQGAGVVDMIIPEGYIMIRS